MKSETESSSYKSILKATTLFGGVQAFQIVISVVRSKIIAVLIGPTGVGLLGIYNAAVELFKNITSLGISQSAVKVISESNASNDILTINRTVAIVRKLVFLTGTLGLIVFCILSPVLSKTSFDNYDYILPFVLLSSILLIDQLASGQRVVLQGLRRYKDLARASAFGSFIGLLVSIPLYLLLGIKGIVPTLILNSAAMLVMTNFFYKRLNIKVDFVKIKEALVEGKSIIKMGIAMSITGILGTLSAFLFRSIISHIGGLSDVGIYTAGYTLVTTYTGLVFTAMATDYYPRLAAINKDNIQCKLIANQQSEVGLLLMTPLMVVCTVFIPIVIKILYTPEFKDAELFIVFSSVGMIFKVLSWSISYLFVAKAESRLFAINETIANINVFVLNVLGYKIAGMLGLGVSNSLAFIIYFVQVYIIAKKRYSYSLDKRLLILSGLSVLLLTCSIIVCMFLSSSTRYLVGAFMVILSTWYSFIEIKKHIYEKKGL